MAESERKFDGYLVEVVEIAPGRTGIYGEVKQAMCRVIDQNSRDKGRVIRRNFVGVVEVGDITRIPDTSREDKRIQAR